MNIQIINRIFIAELVYIMHIVKKKSAYNNILLFFLLNKNNLKMISTILTRLILVICIWMFKRELEND